MAAALLCIEDNRSNQLLIEKGLGEDFQVNCTNSADKGLELANSESPDVILLDVNMPDKSGYQICEQLRANKATETIPVIFVSGMTSLEDRLKGYQAGGDDYICKPVNINELKSKIKSHLNRQQESNDLKQQLQSASSTAMLAMTTNGETGAVLNFIIDTYQCVNYEKLAKQCFNFLAQFGLKGCLQIRAFDKSFDFSSNEKLSPLEYQILASGASAERIVNVGNKSVFSEPHATLLIKNMPLDDQDLAGRLRDHLALAIKGIEARLMTLRLEEESRKGRNEKLTNVIRLLREQMQGLDQHFCGLYQQIQTITEDLTGNIEDRLISMGLSNAQESELMEILKEGNNQFLDLNDTSSELDNRFLHLEASLIEATLL